MPGSESLWITSEPVSSNVVENDVEFELPFQQ
jgi:hypothetical protein